MKNWFNGRKIDIWRKLDDQSLVGIKLKVQVDEIAFVLSGCGHKYDSFGSIRSRHNGSGSQVKDD
jgi:hypothetical protein